MSDSPASLDDLTFEVQETTITLRNEQWGTIGRALGAAGGIRENVDADQPRALGVLTDLIRHLAHDPEGQESSDG